MREQLKKVRGNNIFGRISICDWNQVLILSSRYFYFRCNVCIKVEDSVLQKVEFPLF